MRSLVVGLVLTLLAGCAHAPTADRPPITVAVIDFGAAGQAEAENGCVMAVLEAGYRVVDKKAIDAALPGDGAPVEHQKLGQTLGADLIIDGGIVAHGKSHKSAPPKLISSRTGDLLALSKARGRLSRNFKLGQTVCSELLRQLP